MICIGIALMVMVMSVQCFTVTYRLNGINRTLLQTPISLFEVAIPLVQDDGEFIAYFNKTELKNNLTYYYNTNLSKYVTNYRITYYFSKTGTTSYCATSKCDAVEVRISTPIIFQTRYQKSMRFEIRRAR